VRLIEWSSKADVARYSEGNEGGCIKQHLNLTRLHGEREYIRQGFVHRIDGIWAIVTRTQNANRAHAISLEDGSTLWLSEDIAPPPSDSSQISQIGFGDIDADGSPEAVLASYEGDVICLSADDGSVKWQIRLPWHINNPRLDLKRASAGSGLNIALTVGNDHDWTRGHSRPRINFVRNPSLVLIGPDGDHNIVADRYDSDNGNGHNTWMYDIDEDGICEICCNGSKGVHWFRHDGEALFSLPCTGEESHPDSVLAFNWLPDREGKEIFYLDGISGIAMADNRGRILRRMRFSHAQASHLQELRIFEGDDGPILLAENIRDRDSKLLCFNHKLEMIWGAWTATDLYGCMSMEWDDDGEDEIVCGSHGRGLFNPRGAEECSFHVMARDGTPLYWHRWSGDTLCHPLAIADVDDDGRPEAIISVGTNGGPEGRYSLSPGHSEHIFVMGEE